MRQRALLNANVLRGEAQLLAGGERGDPRGHHAAADPLVAPGSPRNSSCDIISMASGGNASNNDSDEMEMLHHDNSNSSSNNSSGGEEGGQPGIIGQTA